MIKIFKIAIDGPAASGKSTTARLVAHRLNFDYIDSGAMYRAITLLAIRNPVSTSDLCTLFSRSTIKFIHLPPSSFSPLPQTQIFLDDENITSIIRTTQITNTVHKLASNSQVREMMQRKQRNYVKQTDKEGVVMDGRDIGTVVFPDADLKLFITADVRVRARRRFEQEMMARTGGADNTDINKMRGIVTPCGLNKSSSSHALPQATSSSSKPKEEITYETILNDIINRDKKDMERKVSPLLKASDAIELNTTSMTTEGQVDMIVGMVRQKLKKRT